ncbi:MAG: hypothetical protein AAGA95_13910, partial [Pseudomonadota bacterium]
LHELARLATAPDAPRLVLERLATSGEALQVTDALRAFAARLADGLPPGRELIFDNEYGPSETHVVSRHRLGGDPAAWPTWPPIGRAIPGARLHVLDRRGEPAALTSIDAALAGRGSVRARMAALRRRLVVPAEERQEVFQTAMEECRRRTLVHWDLGAEEGVDLLWTRDVEAAWHRFDGSGRSTLQVNPLAIATIDQALEIACHETYPGHHAQFVLFEAEAGDVGLALEDQLVLLRSPASAFREAAAMNAVSLAFSAEDRLLFERDVLFPLAGLDPADAELLQQLRPHLAQLALAVPVIIQEHEDRELSDAEAINRLQSEALVASPRALFAFAHDVGALLAGYTILNAELASRLGALPGNDAWAQLRGWLGRPDTWRTDSPAAPR